jgi:co-chaperonin GroES (HSP10)
VIFASEDDPGARDEQGKLVPPDVGADDIVLFGKWRAGQNPISNLP